MNSEAKDEDHSIEGKSHFETSVPHEDLNANELRFIKSVDKEFDLKMKENLVSSYIRVSSDDQESIGKGLGERVRQNIETLVSVTPLSTPPKVNIPSKDFLSYSSFLTSYFEPSLMDSSIKLEEVYVVPGNQKEDNVEFLGDIQVTPLVTFVNKPSNSPLKTLINSISHQNVSIRSKG